MKQLLTSAGFAAMLLLCAVSCQAQKIKPYVYKVVDTLHSYEDAEIIVYKQNGIIKRDTIYYDKMKQEIKIETCQAVILDRDKKVRQRKK